MNEEEDDTRAYTVVVNHEEQFSVWLADRQLPEGWRSAGKTGPKADCLGYIEQVWTDMRPLSLRRQMEEWARNAPTEPLAPEGGAVEPKDDLVERLGTEQAIRAVLRPSPSVEHLTSAIRRGYVQILFVATGTEIGVRLNEESRDSAPAGIAGGAANLRLEGELVLNYKRVRFAGVLDPRTFEGRGRLEFLGEMLPEQS